MSAMFDIKNAKFLNENLSNDGNHLGNFAISIGGRKRIVCIPYTIPVGPDRPIGRARVRARSYKEECIFIKNLVHGDRVDLFVIEEDANEKDARFGVFSLGYISRSL